jgi:hypothetical protein
MHLQVPVIEKTLYALEGVESVIVNVLQKEAKVLPITQKEALGKELIYEFCLNLV